MTQKCFSVFSFLRDLKLGELRLVTSQERPGQARQIQKVACLNYWIEAYIWYIQYTLTSWCCLIHFKKEAKVSLDSLQKEANNVCEKSYKNWRIRFRKLSEAQNSTSVNLKVQWASSWQGKNYTRQKVTDVYTK